MEMVLIAHLPNFVSLFKLGTKGNIRSRLKSVSKVKLLLLLFKLETVDGKEEKSVKVDGEEIRENEKKTFKWNQTNY